jgi:hypothetical protein
MESPKTNVTVAVRQATQKNQADVGEPVDAPGKRHRKPPPLERLDKRLGEVTGKQMGQKSVKNGMRRGRG